MRRARHVLAGHADERAGEIGRARSRGLIGQGCWRRTTPAASSRPRRRCGRRSAGARSPLRRAARCGPPESGSGAVKKSDCGRVRHARHHAQVPAVLLVVRHVQIVELRRVVVAHEPGRLLEVRRLELHRGDRAVAVRLLAARHQRLPENAADGFAAIQPQIPGACAQAEQFLGLRRAQPLEVDGQLIAVEILANRGAAANGAAGSAGAGVSSSGSPLPSSVRSQSSLPQAIFWIAVSRPEHAAAAVGQRPSA